MKNNSTRSCKGLYHRKRGRKPKADIYKLFALIIVIYTVIFALIVWPLKFNNDNGKVIGGVALLIGFVFFTKIATHPEIYNKEMIDTACSIVAMSVVLYFSSFLHRRIKIK